MSSRIKYKIFIYELLGRRRQSAAQTFFSSYSIFPTRYSRLFHIFLNPAPSQYKNYGIYTKSGDDKRRLEHVFDSILFRYFAAVLIFYILLFDEQYSDAAWKT